MQFNQNYEYIDYEMIMIIYINHSQDKFEENDRLKVDFM